MQTTHHEIVTFSHKFKSVVTDSERYCLAVRAIELQENACLTLENLLSEARGLKSKAISHSLEDEANAMLSYEQLIMAVISELKMWVAIKRNSAAEAWDNLIQAQSAVRDAMRASEVASNLEGYVEKLYALETMLFPPMMFFSIGGIIEESSCSICRKDYETCEHIKGKPYMGEICTRVISGFDLHEISIVDEPANKYARVVSITDESGDKRDILTWRIIEEASQNARESKDDFSE